MGRFRAALRLVPITVVALLLFVEGSSPLSAQDQRRAGRPPRAAETAPPPPDKPAPPAPANPLSKIFRSLLGAPEPGGNDRSGALETEQARAERRGPRDAVDGRIPHNSNLGKHLEHAEQLVAAGNTDQALELLEIILANSDHATIRTADGRPGLVAWEANRLLARLPNGVRETYRLRHEAQARQLARDARETGNWDQLIDVATRFFHTETGQRAADSVANFHFDRGEFGLASLWYLRLLETAPAWTQDSKWRLKVALALREAGNADASDELLGRLRKQGADAEIDVGGDSVKPEAWLKRFGGVDLGAPPVLDEWLQFLGSASRSGTASGGDPLLLSRWFHATTQNKLVLDQIETLAQDLADSGRGPIPTAFPLMVRNRVAFRTLRGVHVIDAESGQLLWETPGAFSDDSLIAPNRTPFDFDERFAFRRFRVNAWGPEFVGGDGADGHPLTGLLYRNANFGLLASDGRRLFVLDDDCLIMHGTAGTGFQVVGDNAENPRRSTPGNRMTAYDLQTGRELWSIGGPVNGDSFDLPLAGHFFFGAPLVEGNDLFIVAERDLDIRLYALDPQSGQVRWSQLLAHSDAKIEQDLGRRWWTAQVAYSNGVLVCPTTVGWLVGIDRLDHSVLWMHRYAPARPGFERREREQGESLCPPRELNFHWCASAPVIAGNRVVYTPSEEPVLVCLDLSSGIPRWQFPKGEEQLYLASVDEERAVVVGKSSVTALDLDKGTTRWQMPIGDANGPPSGRGLTANGRLYLPLRNGGLWTIELTTGKVLERSQLPLRSKPLGNLAMYRGLVLSLNAFGLTAFEQRQSIERQIAERRATNPRDEWASVKRAEIALLEHDPGAALASLDRVDPQHAEKLGFSSYRSALIEALAAAVRRNYADGDQPLERLAKIAKSGEERLLLGRLQVEQALAKEQFGTAFTLLQQLAIGRRAGVKLVRPDDSQVTVDFDQWIAGQLADTWAKMSPSDRTKCDVAIQTEAEHVLRLDRSFQERFAALYAFHPAALPVIETLVGEFAAQNDLFHAERLLLRLTRSTDAKVAAASQRRLAQLLEKFHLSDDADAAYRELARAFRGVSLEQGVTADGLVDARRNAGLMGRSSVAGADWGDADLKIYRFGTNVLSQHVEELALGQTGAPFFRNHRFSVDERRQRLEIVRAKNDAQHWLLPLRNPGRTRQGEYTVGVPAGHELVVLHRDVLHFLAPVERRVVWTRSVDVPSGLGSEYRAPHAAIPQPLHSGSQFATSLSLLSRATQRGMLAAANTEYVCLYGRREFVVLDAGTGDVRWKCANIPQHATVFGTEDVVYLIPPDRSQAVAFRASDGKRLDAERLGDRLVNTVAVTPRGLVIVDGLSTGILGLEAPRTTVRLFDPTTRTESWKVQYPGGAKLALLDDLQLLAVSASGEIERLDFLTGEVRRFQGKCPRDALQSRADVYAIADRDHVFLMIHQRRRSMQYPEGFRSITAGGLILAFDAQDGRLLWTNNDLSREDSTRKGGAAQNLVLDFLRDSPLLTFASRGLVQNHEFGHWNLNLAVIDKQTGRTVLMVTDPSASNLRTLELNMADRYIELRSYNQRMRLIAVNRSSARAAGDPKK